MSDYLEDRLDINLKNLEVLDEKIKELKSLTFVNELPVPDEDGVHPYFYGAIGADGLPGISTLGAVPPHPPQSGIVPRTYFQGTIQLHADAPFIWTHMAVTCRLFRDSNFVDTGGNLVEPNTTSSQYSSLYSSVVLNQNTAFFQSFPVFNIGVIDSASGRNFFQVEEQQSQVGGSEQKGLLVPGAVFDTQKTLNYWSNIEGAPGHGPNDFFELPSQTELPMNGTLRVEAQPSEWNSIFGQNSYRVFVTLIGYKILVD